MKTTIAALLALSTFSPVLAGEYQPGYSKTEKMEVSVPNGIFVLPPKETEDGV